MPAELLPLFPLSFVLLPGMPVPLHIFEDRYKEMVRDISDAAGEFGVVLAKEEGIVSIGCSARIDRIVNRYADGRLDLIAIGARRFRIESVDQERSYLRAEVEFFDDEDTSEPRPDLKKRALAAYRELLLLENEDEPEAQAPRFSFQIGQLIRDLEKRQTLLTLVSETERLEFLVKALPEYIVRQQRTALAKRVAPQNGHARGL